MMLMRLTRLTTIRHLTACTQEASPLGFQHLAHHLAGLLSTQGRGLRIQ